jgi:hypothetical protein
VGRLDRLYRKVNRAIEAFEREFAPWALKLPAADVAARRGGQLRVNGWSVLYEFGSDAYGEYLDYYAALRGATDARVNDDWHARIYATGQIVAFPAVLEAYLYGRDPSPEELDRAREPVLASLAPPAPEAEESAAEESTAEESTAEETAATIGTADTALWENLREVVEAEVAAVPPRRPSAETPAEIDSVLDAAFGVERPAGERAPIELQAAAAADTLMSAAPSAAAPPNKPQTPKPVDVPAPAKPAAAKPEPPAAKEPEEEQPPPEAQPPSEEPAPPRRSVPGYDPFVELRTLEPKSARRPAPIGDDFRPYWQRYPARAAGIAAAVAAVLLVTLMLIGRSAKKPARGESADTTSASTSRAADTAYAAKPQPDTQAVASPQDTPDTAPAPAPAPASVAIPSSGSESSIARPVGPGSIAPIVRTDGSAASPTSSHRFAHPSGS